MPLCSKGRLRLSRQKRREKPQSAKVVFSWEAKVIRRNCLNKWRDNLYRFGLYYELVATMSTLSAFINYNDKNISK
jgi:hypothetical protein